MNNNNIETKNTLVESLESMSDISTSLSKKIGTEIIYIRGNKDTIEQCNMPNTRNSSKLDKMYNEVMKSAQQLERKLGVLSKCAETELDKAKSVL